VSWCSFCIACFSFRLRRKMISAVVLSSKFIAFTCGIHTLISISSRPLVSFGNTRPILIHPTPSSQLETIKYPAALTYLVAWELKAASARQTIYPDCNKRLASWNPGKPKENLNVPRASRFGVCIILHTLLSTTSQHYLTINLFCRAPLRTRKSLLHSLTLRLLPEVFEQRTKGRRTTLKTCRTSFDLQKYWYTEVGSGLDFLAISRFYDSST